MRVLLRLSCVLFAACFVFLPCVSRAADPYDFIVMEGLSSISVEGTVTYDGDEVGQDSDSVSIRGNFQASYDPAQGDFDTVQINTFAFDPQGDLAIQVDKDFGDFEPEVEATVTFIDTTLTLNLPATAAIDGGTGVAPILNLDVTLSGSIQYTVKVKLLGQTILDETVTETLNETFTIPALDYSTSPFRDVIRSQTIMGRFTMTASDTAQSDDSELEDFELSYTVTVTIEGRANAPWIDPISIDFSTGQQNWLSNDPAPSGDYDVALAEYFPGRGIGFTATDADAILFGEWGSGTGEDQFVRAVVPADETNVGPDNILHLTATISGTAQRAADSPGWRLYYASDAFTHMGGLSASTFFADGAGVHAPYNDGSPQNLMVHLYWAVPYELTEYGDADLLANFGPYNPFFDDARDYKVAWNMIDWEMADVGEIVLEALEVEVVSRPGDKTPEIEWGGSGLPFDSGALGWMTWGKEPPGIGLGTWSSAPDGVVIGPGSGPTGYIETSPNPAALAGQGIDWGASQLYRHTTEWTSVDSPNTSPMFRILGIVYSASNPFRSLLWFEQFGGDIVAKSIVTPAQASVAPAAPETTGSTLETYLYTHNGDGGVLYPTIDCYNAGLYDGTTWPNTTGRIELSRFGIEKDVLN